MPPYLNEDCGYDNTGLLGSSNTSDDMEPWVSVPLVGVNVEAEVLDFVAEVKLSQCYHNVRPQTIEATYHFPIDESAAVCGFQAEYDDGTIISGVIKQKDEARIDYHQAMADGKQASLLETVKPDVFTIRVGNLEPGSFVKITITYLTTLKTRDSALAFVLPTFVAPRYVPPLEEVKEALVAPTGGTISWLGLHIHIRFTCTSKIRTVTSPTHATDPSLSIQIEDRIAHASMHNIALDRDLVFLVVEEHSHQPRVVLERSDMTGSLAGFVTLFPELEFIDLPREFIFLIDQSGSMKGLKIAQAKETLLLFLRALPASSTFNIVGFGSRHQALFPSPQQYNDDTLGCATQHVLQMQPNLGGTELVAPLQSIFQQPSHEVRERQVFVLTDGQVSNDDQVFQIVRDHCSELSSTAKGRCRLFSVGLGAGASRHLVEGMASAGCGTSRFVEEGGAVALREKVLGQLKQASQPYLGNVCIEWIFPENDSLDAPPPVQLKTLLDYRSPEIDRHRTKAKQQPKIFPSVIPPLFNKQKFLSFAQFKNGLLPTGVRVSCDTTSEGRLETTLDISPADVFQGTIAHKMTARAAIAEYEAYSETTTKRRSLKFQPLAKDLSIITDQEALHLALENSLMSKKTSFVVVHDGCAEEIAVNSSRESLSEVPTATATIGRLRTAIQTEKKREQFILKRIDQRVAEAKTKFAQGNKKSALYAMKQKLLYERELEKSQSNKMTLETQILQLESAGQNADVYNAMKAGEGSMSKLYAAASGSRGPQTVASSFFPADKLIGLCLLQKANGSFELDNSLINAVCMTEAKAATARAACLAALESHTTTVVSALLSICGTALAVAAFAYVSVINRKPGSFRRARLYISCLV